MDFKDACTGINRLKENLARVILGKPEAIDLCICTLLARGHLLIEDVPGVGKTTLAHALARSIDCSFSRIQFTSDLLPSDVVGLTVYNGAERKFEFRPGPVFANIVLADEINRTTPKTQSALLEAMSERQVSIDRATYPLPEPFMLLATQNPLEYAGTFPLPESQLDRFTMSIKIGYPDAEHEREIIRSSPSHETPETLGAVVDTSEVELMQGLCAGVRMDDDLVGYIHAVSSATREHRAVRLGASPRASMTLYRAAQARAMVENREYCIPDDIKRLAVPVLAHRIITVGRGMDEGAGTAETVIQDILSSIDVPI